MIFSFFPTFLSKNKAHIWCVAHNKFTNFIKKLRTVLSEEEQHQANRFYFAKDQERYIVARGLLRHILSWYVACKPASISFIYNKYGKPELSPICNPLDLNFNLSHSGEIILYSFILHSAIGIDVERICPKSDYENIVYSHFSDIEKEMFSKIPDRDKNKAFFHYWTRKESYIKALGMGLSYPLNEFSVCFLPGQESKYTNIIKKNGEKDDWVVRTIAPMPGYTGAVSVKRSNIKLYFLHLSPDKAMYEDLLDSGRD